MDRSRGAVRIVAMAVLAGLLIVHIAGSPARGAQPQDQAQAPPDTAVFEMKYRGLDAPDDPLSYRSYWGFGAPAGPVHSAFVEAVRRQVKECELVYNRQLPDRDWSVVELADGKPVALHFDVNADGEVSENERFRLVSLQNLGYQYGFITSDFTIRTQDGREVLFRVMLVGHLSGSGQISWMWSPCCLLEGQAILAGEPMRLFLYGQGFSGSFMDFGGSSFSLVPAGQKLKRYISRSTLSSLTNYDGTFYRLEFSGAHDKGKTLRVILKKDSSPTGNVAMRLAAKDAGKSRLTGATINGAADATVHFHVADAGAPLPVMRYGLSSGYVHYGVESDDQWRVNFSDGPEFTVEAGQTTQIELGEPTLSVRAIDERDRYNSDAKEQTTFANKTTIYLAPRIRGKAGEVYMRFTQKGGAGSYADVEPHYAIVDSDGKQVAAGDMEYG